MRERGSAINVQLLRNPHEFVSRHSYFHNLTVIEWEMEMGAFVRQRKAKINFELNFMEYGEVKPKVSRRRRTLGDEKL